MDPIRALSEYSKAVEQGQNVFLKINKEGKLEVEKHGRTWQVLHKIKAFFSSDHAYDLKKIAKKLDELSPKTFKAILPEERDHFEKGLGLLSAKVIKYDQARVAIGDDSAFRSLMNIISRSGATARFIGDYQASPKEKAIIYKIPDHLWNEFLALREKAPDLDSPETSSLIGRFRDLLNAKFDERTAKQLGQIMQKINSFEALKLAQQWNQPSQAQAEDLDIDPNVPD